MLNCTENLRKSFPVTVYSASNCIQFAFISYGVSTDLCIPEISYNLTADTMDKQVSQVDRISLKQEGLRKSLSSKARLKKGKYTCSQHQAVAFVSYLLLLQTCSYRVQLFQTGLSLKPKSSVLYLAHMKLCNILLNMNLSCCCDALTLENFIGF